MMYPLLGGALDYLNSTIFNLTYNIPDAGPLPKHLDEAVDLLAEVNCRVVTPHKVNSTTQIHHAMHYIHVQVADIKRPF